MSTCRSGLSSPAHGSFLRHTVVRADDMQPGMRSQPPPLGAQPPRRGAARPARTGAPAIRRIGRHKARPYDALLINQPPRRGAARPARTRASAPIWSAMARHRSGPRRLDAVREPPPAPPWQGGERVALSPLMRGAHGAAAIDDGSGCRCPPWQGGPVAPATEGVRRVEPRLGKAMSSPDVWAGLEILPKYPRALQKRASPPQTDLAPYRL